MFQQHLTPVDAVDIIEQAEHLFDVGLTPEGDAHAQPSDGGPHTRWDIPQYV